MNRSVVAACAALVLLLGLPGLGAAQLGTLLKRKAEEMASRAEAEAVAADALAPARGTAGEIACIHGRRCQGVYFDTGSDRVRPDAARALREIAALQAEHPGLGFVIEGHTDNVGNAEANLALSRRRAAAVREALVTSFGADASRLSVKGMGATKPAASNDTPGGRQTNRRVELARSEE